MRERKKNSRTARVTYEERIVAFVDIMGFKQLVEDSLVDQEEFSRIRDALERFRELKEEKDGSELEKYIKIFRYVWINYYKYNDFYNRNKTIN